MKRYRNILTSGLLLASLAFVGACSKENGINPSERYLSFGVKTADMYVTKGAAAEATEPASSVTLKTPGGNVYLPMTVTEEPNRDFAAAGTKAESISDITSFYTKGFDDNGDQWFPASGSPELVTTGKQYSGYRWLEDNEYFFLAYSDLPDYASATIADKDMTLTLSSIPSDAEAQQDILLGVYEGDGNGEGKAAMNFYHPLSSVIFKLGSGTMSITGISIDRVKKGGSTVWSEASESGGLLEFDWSDATGSIKVEQQILSPGTDDQLGVPFMLIPQTFTSENPATITVTATVDGVAKEFTASLTSGEWKSGMKYTYTLNFASGPDPDFWVDLGLKSVNGYPLLVSKYDVSEIAADGTVTFVNDELEIGEVYNYTDLPNIPLIDQSGVSCRPFTSSELLMFIDSRIENTHVTSVLEKASLSIEHVKDNVFINVKPKRTLEDNGYQHELILRISENDDGICLGTGNVGSKYMMNYSVISWDKNKEVLDILTSGSDTYPSSRLRLVCENVNAPQWNIIDIKIGIASLFGASFAEKQSWSRQYYDINESNSESTYTGDVPQTFALWLEFSDGINSIWGSYDETPWEYVDYSFDDYNGGYSFDYYKNIIYVNREDTDREWHGGILKLWLKNNPDLCVTFTKCANYCLVKGTLITLADGSQKPVEEITYDDKVKVWNFDKGCYDEANFLFISQPGLSHNHYIKLTFSDGNVLNVTGQNSHHHIYNYGKRFFEGVTKMDIGSEVFTENGVVTLVSKEWIEEEVEYYNFITVDHVNCFANGVLTSSHYGNIYPIDENMKFIKDGRKKVPYKEFKKLGISREWYNDLRLGEQPDSLDVLKKYVDKVQSYQLEKPAPTFWQRFRTWFKSVFGCNS